MLAAQSSSLLLRRPLTMIRMTWHRLIRNVRDPYRPELHYMRGPGPKWHAKHHARTDGNAL